MGWVVEEWLRIDVKANSVMNDSVVTLSQFVENTDVPVPAFVDGDDFENKLFDSINEIIMSFSLRGRKKNKQQTVAQFVQGMVKSYQDTVLESNAAKKLILSKFALEKQNKIKFENDWKREIEARREDNKKSTDKINELENHKMKLLGEKERVKIELNGIIQSQTVKMEKLEYDLERKTLEIQSLNKTIEDNDAYWNEKYDEMTSWKIDLENRLGMLELDELYCDLARIRKQEMLRLMEEAKTMNEVLVGLAQKNAALEGYNWIYHIIYLYEL